MGGKFQDGFLSAAVTKAATFMPGLGAFLNPNSGQGNILTRTALAAIIGGTASAVGGGKFANGAYTAAMQHLFNEELLHPLAKEYDPSKDQEWLNQIAASEKFIQEEFRKLQAEVPNIKGMAIIMELHPELIFAVITNETRGWAKIGGYGLAAQNLAGEVKNTFLGNMFSATVGPAQLGPEARRIGMVGYLEAKTFKGAAFGAMSYLNHIRGGLVAAGVSNPTSAQIASRYNAALTRFPAGTVTRYGLQVQYLISSRKF